MKKSKGILTALALLVVFCPIPGFADDPDVFGVEVGNRSTYRGPFYTMVQEFVCEDKVTFPTTTYVCEERHDGILEAKGWMETTPQELRLWGLENDDDGGEFFFFKFSDGLIIAWYPMAVSDDRYSSATMTVEGYPGYVFNVSMTVDAIAKELVTLDFATLEAFRVRYELRMWGHGLDETDIFTQWVVPYLGSVKYESDTTVEELTAFEIGGGTITQNTDWDYDGLKDYEELVIYGTKWQDGDTDGDDCEDGAEVFGGRNPKKVDPLGDVNTDCAVDLADAILALQVAAGMNPAPVHSSADANDDDKIGLEEVIYVVQKVSGLR